MEVLLIFFLFILGLCVGSFLNVLIYRLPRDLSPFKGRSFCPKCKHQIVWKDNIPLLSFVLLRGRCRYCHSPISWQYPLVELITAMVTLLIFFHLGGVPSLWGHHPRWTDGYLGGVFDYLFILFVVYSLIVIFFTDLFYQIIPDNVIFPAMGITILFHLQGLFRFVPPSEESLRQAQDHLGGGTSLSLLGGALLSGLGAAGFFLCLFLLTKGKGMGLGDVKLAFLMGLFLGFPKIVIALYLAFLTGAFIGVILILLKKKRFGEHIPFGPFLVGGTLGAMFWGEEIFKLWLKIIQAS